MKKSRFFYWTFEISYSMGEYNLAGDVFCFWKKVLVHCAVDLKPWKLEKHQTLEIKIIGKNKTLLKRILTTSFIIHHTGQGHAPLSASGYRGRVTWTWWLRIIRHTSPVTECCSLADKTRLPRCGFDSFIRTLGTSEDHREEKKMVICTEYN